MRTVYQMFLPAHGTPGDEVSSKESDLGQHIVCTITGLSCT